MGKTIKDVRPRKKKRTEPLPEAPNYEQLQGIDRVAVDPRLSLGAKGLYLQIKACGFYRVDAMLQLNPAGITALRSYIKELVQFGYLKRTRGHMPQGGYEWTTELLDGTKV